MKRKLPPDNPGLVAAAVAINNGISQRLAVDYCNQTNKRLNVECPEIGRTQLMETIRAYTDVTEDSLLQRKTGSRDENSPWAKARNERCMMEIEQIEASPTASEPEVHRGGYSVPMTHTERQEYLRISELGQKLGIAHLMPDAELDQE